MVGFFNARSLHSSNCLLPSFGCLSFLLDILLGRGSVFVIKSFEVGGGGCFHDRIVAGLPATLKGQDLGGCVDRVHVFLMFTTWTINTMKRHPLQNMECGVTKEGRPRPDFKLVPPSLCHNQLAKAHFLRHRRAAPQPNRKLLPVLSLPSTNHQ